MNPKNRPAESSGVAAALALLICRLLGVDDADTIVALGIVVGFIPAAVTWAVSLRSRESGYALVEVLLAVFLILVILVVLSWLV